MGTHPVDKLEVIQWVIIGLQLLALVYFNYYMIQYNKKFRLIRQDLLTLISFVCVEFTLLSKLILRTTSIIAIREESNEDLADYLNNYRGKSKMVCMYDLAFPIGVTFFTIALTLNAIRWVYQIIFL